MGQKHFRAQVTANGTMAGIPAEDPDDAAGLVRDAIFSGHFGDLEVEAIEIEEENNE